MQLKKIICDFTQIIEIKSFSHRNSCGSLSSTLLRSFECWTVTDVSEEIFTYIFRVCVAKEH